MMINNSNSEIFASSSDSEGHRVTSPTSALASGAQSASLLSLQQHAVSATAPHSLSPSYLCVYSLRVPMSKRADVLTSLGGDVCPSPRSSPRNHLPKPMSRHRSRHRFRHRSERDAPTKDYSRTSDTSAPRSSINAPLLVHRSHRHPAVLHSPCT